MNDKQRNIGENDLGTLAEDARALISATADVAGDKVAEARRRLSTALDNGKEILGRVREKAVDSARAADQIVRDNPYQTLFIAFGVGAVIGYLAARQCSSNTG